MANGYFNKKLVVDLTEKRTSSESIADETLLQFMGGSGLATRMLCQHLDADLSPTSPQRRLYFTTGPFTGTRIPSTGRHALVAISPLTGIFGESDVGGYFGTALKRSGCDALEIFGEAEKPFYLHISDSGVDIKDASHLWGRDAYVTSDMLRSAHGKKSKVAAIGVAGENQVPMASVMHDGHHGRAAGRCGLGCVMGAKRLKAIVVSGTQSLPIADPQGLKRQVRDMLSRIKASSAYLRQYGTSGGLMCLEASGDMPIKNFAQGHFAAGERITGEILAETYLSGRFACGACPIGCGREIKIESGKYGPVSGAGPEYETLASLGTYCLIDDLAAICKGNELCNRYGLDTISVGAAIAFAMEAYDNGLITAADTGGVSLKWGNADAMLAMVNQIGNARGLGKILGQGVRKAADLIGANAHDFAVHVKGLEFPAHDPRAYFSSGLSYATSNRGACHLAGLTHGLEGGLTLPDLGFHEPFDRFSEDGKGAMVARMQNLMGLFDSLKICKFLLYTGITPTDLVKCLTLVTGQEWDLDRFLETGERIFQLKRLVNVKLGVTRSADDLPNRMKMPLKTGGTKGHVPDLQSMLDDYYRIRGWTRDGAPTSETLKRLGLNPL
jgi:aldehyde:ferredoxin oxidoreductase